MNDTERSKLVAEFGLHIKISELTNELAQASDKIVELVNDVVRLKEALLPFACKCRVKGEGAGGNCITKTGKCSSWTARIALERKK
jgi:hypothetical protein